MSDLAAAINRAYHAWVRTQPQLILDLWGDGGLEEPQRGDVLRLVEPAGTPSWVGLDAAPGRQPSDCRRRRPAYPGAAITSPERIGV